MALKAPYTETYEQASKQTNIFDGTSTASGKKCSSVKKKPSKKTKTNGHYHHDDSL